MVKVKDFVLLKVDSIRNVFLVKRFCELYDIIFYGKCEWLGGDFEGLFKSFYPEIALCVPFKLKPRTIRTVLLYLLRYNEIKNYNIFFNE